MKKKIVIAVDGSLHCTHAMRYAAALAPAISDLHYVLLHIQPAISHYLSHEAQNNPQTRRALKKLLATNEQNSRQILEKAHNLLIQWGIAPECIEVRTHVRINGVAQDILDACQASPYDAVVVGRRGLGRMQEWVTGSVTANLLAHAQWTPVWMVDGQVTSPSILMASDGSPNALRAMDHLAFMLHGNLHAKLHVVHVCPRPEDILAFDLDQETMAATEAALASDTRQRMGLFEAQAQEVLLKNGLKADQLSVHTIKSRFAIATAILDAAREGGFGTIVLGRSSTPKGFFTGSVARKVVQKATNMAIWWVS